VTRGHEVFAIRNAVEPEATVGANCSVSLEFDDVHIGALERPSIRIDDSADNGPRSGGLGSLLRDCCAGTHEQQRDNERVSHFHIPIL
jgi:hypothetical protein